MQELLRSDYDLYEEQVEYGGNVADPQVVCIKKGTTTIHRGLSSVSS